MNKMPELHIRGLKAEIKTIFVFDEARNLINTKFRAKLNSEKEFENYLIILRRTLKNLPKNCFH